VSACQAELLAQEPDEVLARVDVDPFLGAIDGERQ
jgi:hypothetical protein